MSMRLYQLFNEVWMNFFYENKYVIVKSVPVPLTQYDLQIFFTSRNSII